MQRLMQWAGSQGHWTQSDFGGLPAVQQEADPVLQRWQVVAGGLALLLSRVSPTERSARFPAAYRLYQGLRRLLRQGVVVDASSELLSDVMHEIVGLVDDMTTQCLRACFDASVRPGYPNADTTEAADSLAASLLRSQSQSRSSSRSKSLPKWRDTSLSCEATPPTSSRRNAPAGKR